MAKAGKIRLSVDDQLAEHLRHAEEALIGAVKLFSDHESLSRRVGYFSRLAKAQEAITALYREELVRMRGPMSPKRKR